MISTCFKLPEYVISWSQITTVKLKPFSLFVALLVSSACYSNSIVLRAQNIGGGQKQIDVDRTFTGLVTGATYELEFEVLFVNKPITISGAVGTVVINSTGLQTLPFTAAASNEVINFYHQSGGAPARIEMDNLSLKELDESISQSCESVFDTDYRYAYNGHEKDDEVKSGTGNSYTTYYRQYDPRLGRWLSMDPKNSPGSSYYAAMGNNPINYVDPFGDTVKFAGDAEEELYNEYKTTVTNKVNGLDSQIAELEASGKKKGKLARLKGQRSTYQGILDELNVIEGSTDIFRIRKGDNISNPAGGGNISFNKNTGEVDVNIGDAGQWYDIQKIAHELKHIYQFTQGDADLHRDGFGGYAYDQHDEIEAFERQNLFAGPQGQNYVSDVPALVRKLYSNRPTGPISTSSTNQYNLKQMEELHYKYGKGGRGTYPAIITAGYTERYAKGVAEYEAEQETNPSGQ